jgi:hypothetical protein
MRMIIMKCFLSVRTICLWPVLGVRYREDVLFMDMMGKRSVKGY